MLIDGDEPYGPPVPADVLAAVEGELGLRLPVAYREFLLTEANGAVLLPRRLATDFPTSWAPDHVAVDELAGVSGPFSLADSQYLVREWGYPGIGLVVARTPSGGHDVLMLDYREPGEPSVAYVDEDRRPRTVAPDFATFLDRLVPDE